MTEAAKKARAAYMREWRSKNRERCKQYAVNQWERRAERMAQERTAGGGTQCRPLTFPAWEPSHRLRPNRGFLLTASGSSAKRGRCAASDADARFL